MRSPVKLNLRRAVMAVLAGYRATGMLFERSMARPFGQASGWHRVWIFPQFVVAMGLAPLVGAVTGYWNWLAAVPVSIVLLSVGLALTAWVGRQAARGDFGPD